MTARLKRKIALVVFVVLSGACAPAMAVTVEGLYAAQVPVASSAPDDLKQGYASGLQQVMLRVSGDSELLNREGAQALLADAQRLVLSYQFLRAQEAGGQDQLAMSFGAVGVNRALASIDAPVWGANRPLTLAWIAVEDRGGRQLVSRQAAQQSTGGTRDWGVIFARAAADRGLPLTLPPIKGGNDRRTLSEVWGQFMEPVKQASADIGHDLLTVVKISRRGDQWEAAWRLEGNGFSTGDETVSATSQEQLARAIVGAWADMLAGRYAVAAGQVADSATVEILVDEVQSLQDYAEVKAALTKMTPVLGAFPVRVTANQMMVQVAFSGELSQVEQYIALDQRFVEVAASTEPTKPNDPGNGSEGTQSAIQPAAGSVAATPSGMPDGEVSEAPATNEGTLFEYRPLDIEQDQELAEQTFESLYPTLKYRWQGSSVIQTGAPSN
ncbi:DUF2066 domain-containing protein [Marinobacter caseinilyticus]|uniref:DUF2066 domain-containing protein n=1 Tax=Marinobacter caseinilyticus TaxID=2692195 RepID=UPI001F18C0ED|nr:DUF2066 domain-containing protein [Marinobacter caseinilyticus]